MDEDGLAVGAVAMDPDVGAARGRASARPSAASEDGRRPDQGARVGWHLAVCFSSIKFISALVPRRIRGRQRTSNNIRLGR